MQRPKIKTYCKKPIPIKALLWDGTNLDDIKRFVGKDLVVHYPTMDDSVVLLAIHTLEGDMAVGLGNYIIQGVRGEFYPCDGEIFKETYEEVV